ncbi:MAG TPA: isochorismatase family cysteine hydrolase [Nitrospirales bacterium]|nr:isochorismatase family cysteine hydrolase [Nitrospirales bacterium]
MAKRRHGNLHGNVPDRAAACLLIIDMINPMTFRGAERMARPALAAAKRLAALKRRLKAAGVPAVYVNDNFGKWRSDFRALVSHCLERSCRGRPLAEALRPDGEDYFILKPKHSAFYATPLSLLLTSLGARRLILTGIAANSCILQTAADAYMREFELIVPSDCTASILPKDTRTALAHVRRMFKADTRPSRRLRITAHRER